MFLLKPVFIAALCIFYEFVGVYGGADFYKLLGVHKGASVKEIRKAFKKIAISKHPDKNTVSFFFFKFNDHKYEFNRLDS